MVMSIVGSIKNVRSEYNIKIPKKKRRDEESNEAGERNNVEP